MTLAEAQQALARAEAMLSIIITLQALTLAGVVGIAAWLVRGEWIAKRRQQQKKGQ